MGIRVPFESSVEADLILIMEVDSTVAGFWAQPETFRWRQDGRARRYTPDFLVQMTDGNFEYREVKLLKHLKRNPTFDGRRERIEQECRTRNAKFEIWTETDVRRLPRYANTRLILSHGGPVRDDRALAALRLVLATAEPTSIGDLLQRARLETEHIGSVLRLIRFGEIGVDLDRPLDSASSIQNGP